MSETRPAAQADFEARMREMAEAGGGELRGAWVMITDPPLKVPSGVDLYACRFELHVPGEGESREASYPLDFAAGEAGTAEAWIDGRGHVYVETHGGGTVSCAEGILKPDGGILAEVPPHDPR